MNKREVWRVVGWTGMILFCVVVGCNEGKRTNLGKVQDFFADKNEAALAAAAARGDVQEIERRVKLGTNVNAVGKESVTPLMWAFVADNKIGFQRLLDLGADPNLQDGKGRSVTCLSAAVEDSDYLRMVLAAGGDPNLESRVKSLKPTPIFWAIEEYNKVNLKILIDAGANLNYQERHGETPMIFASNLNWWDIVYMLLEAGADYAIPNTWGNTIVYHIESYPIDPKSEGYRWRQKVIAFLRERGVEVNPKVP